MTAQNTNTAQTAILLAVILIGFLFLGQTLLPKFRSLAESPAKAIKKARIEQVMKI